MFQICCLDVFGGESGLAVALVPAYGEDGCVGTGPVVGLFMESEQCVYKT